MRLLVWLVLAGVVVWLLRGKQAPRKSNPSSSDKTSSTASPASAEAMVQCLHCDVYLPESEAIFHSPHEIFCCESHRNQHLTR